MPYKDPAAKRQYQREYMRNRRAASKAVPKPAAHAEPRSSDCRRCGSPFDPGSTTREWCSPECRALDGGIAPIVGSRL